MKVTVENKEENKSKYPCLMESDGLIVLFVGHGEGFVIIDSDGDKVYELGSFSDVWAAEDFKPFNGSITLSND